MKRILAIAAIIGACFVGRAQPGGSSSASSVPAHLPSSTTAQNPITHIDGSKTMYAYPNLSLGIGGITSSVPAFLSGLNATNGVFTDRGTNFMGFTNDGSTSLLWFYPIPASSGVVGIGFGSTIGSLDASIVWNRQHPDELIFSSVGNMAFSAGGNGAGNSHFQIGTSSANHDQAYLQYDKSVTGGDPLGYSKPLSFALQLHSNGTYYVYPNIQGVANSTNGGRNNGWALDFYDGWTGGVNPPNYSGGWQKGNKWGSLSSNLTWNGSGFFSNAITAGGAAAVTGTLSVGGQVTTTGAVYHATSVVFGSSGASTYDGLYLAGSHLFLIGANGVESELQVKNSDSSLYYCRFGQFGNYIVKNGLTVGSTTQAGGNNFRVDTGVAADGGGIKHGRVTTGSIGATASALVTNIWSTAFADASYTVTCSVQDSTAALLSLSVTHIEKVSTTNVVVRISNTSAGSLTGTLHLIAIHD